VAITGQLPRVDVDGPWTDPDVGPGTAPLETDPGLSSNPPRPYEPWWNPPRYGPPVPGSSNPPRTPWFDGAAVDGPGDREVEGRSETVLDDVDMSEDPPPPMK